MRAALTSSAITAAVALLLWFVVLDGGEQDGRGRLDAAFWLLVGFAFVEVLTVLDSQRRTRRGVALGVVVSVSVGFLGYWGFYLTHVSE